jgi:hypothetical protein
MKRPPIEEHLHSRAQASAMFHKRRLSNTTKGKAQRNRSRAVAGTTLHAAAARNEEQDVEILLALRTVHLRLSHHPTSV